MTYTNGLLWTNIALTMAAICYVSQNLGFAPPMFIALALAGVEFFGDILSGLLSKNKES